jgi:molybdate transport system substrate-binding protein
MPAKRKWLIVLLSVSAGVTPAGCTAPTAVPVAPTAATATVAPPATHEEAPTEPPERELTVFAAASLTDAFGQIGAAFEESHPGVTVAFNFAGSQALRTQIEEGAAADVFASANKTELEALIASGHIEPDGGRLFAGNRLVVIMPEDNPAGIATLEDLARPGVKLVLAAEEVPVGKYARQALMNLNALLGSPYAESVLANVVSHEDNVRQVVAKVSLGEADAGIVYSTDAMADPSLVTISIDDPYNVTASYPLAVLAGAPQPDLAAQFAAFVLSQEGQAILASYGFLPPPPG